jgi:hypothetical protein
MLHFLSYDLELWVHDILVRDDGLKLCVGTDYSGQQWLLFRAVAEEDRQVWVCAPASARAIDCVRKGTASVGDALRHSLTGLVEIVTVGRDRGTPDRCVRGSDIPTDLLPALPWHLGANPRPGRRPTWSWPQSGRDTGVPAA